MTQKYKVFSDKSVLEIKQSAKKDIPVAFVVPILSFKHFMEITKNGQIQFTTSQLNRDFKNMFQSFEHIMAAGGIVKNSGKILLINRFGYWDLPKGKLEIGENPSECAMREVQEECGLNNDLSIIQELNPTYHVYEYGSQSILKKTYWFKMESTYSGKLTPQEEEDIIDCRWVPIEELGKYMVSAYPLIANLLKDFILDK